MSVKTSMQVPPQQGRTSLPCACEPAEVKGQAPRNSHLEIPPCEIFHPLKPSWCCSVAKTRPTLWDHMNCSMPGFPVLHCLLEFAQTHVHWVSDAFQPSHLLSSPSPPVLNPSQHQCLFQSVGSSHQVAKVLEPQLQHQSFQWIFRVDFL